MWTLILLLAAGTDESALAAAPEVREDALFPPTSSVLPGNGRIAVLQEGVSITDVSTGTRIPVSQRAGEGPSASLQLLDLDLSARPTVDLLARCQDCDTDRFFSWIVGANDLTAPEYSSEEIRSFVGVDSNSPRRWGVSVCLPPLVEDEPVLHVLHADEDVVLAQPSGGSCLMGSSEEAVPGTFFYVVVPATAERDRLCVSADVVDVAGNADSLPQTCIPLQSEEESSGCAAAGAPTPLLLVGLGLRAAPRRRRGLR
jgi:hypothetical protein